MRYIACLAAMSMLLCGQGQPVKESESVPPIKADAEMSREINILQNEMAQRAEIIRLMICLRAGVRADECGALDAPQRQVRRIPGKSQKVDGK